jgi:hypothetical protein
MSRPPPATLGLVPPGPMLGSEPGSMLQRIVLKQFHFILFHLINSITLHQPAGTTRFLPCSLFLVPVGSCMKFGVARSDTSVFFAIPERAWFYI